MKYVIDIPDDGQCRYRYNKDTKELKFPSLRLDPNMGLDITITISGVTPYTEPDREAIENEVWEFVRALFSSPEEGGMTWQELVHCMGNCAIDGILTKFSYQEAKAKYDAWKKEKEEVHVGDEVTAKTDTDKDMPKGIVTYNNPEQSQFLVIKSDGTFSWWHKGGLRKTGRHFSEVEKLLEKMKGE